MGGIDMEPPGCFTGRDIVRKVADNADELDAGNMRVLDDAPPAKAPGETAVAAPAPSATRRDDPGTAAEHAGLDGMEYAGIDEELLCPDLVAGHGFKGFFHLHTSRTAVLCPCVKKYFSLISFCNTFIKKVLLLTHVCNFEAIRE
jgi:hypothetical protein